MKKPYPQSCFPRVWVGGGVGVEGQEPSPGVIPFLRAAVMRTNLLHTYERLSCHIHGRQQMLGARDHHVQKNLFSISTRQKLRWTVRRVDE
jgi:hypothetical protein